MPQSSYKAAFQNLALVLLMFCYVTPLHAWAQNLADLETQLLSEDVAVRTKAIAQLVEKGRLLQEDSQQLLLEHAKDEVPEIRKLVAQGLGKYHDPDPAAVETLIVLLKDTDENVRLETIQSLGRLAAVSQSAILPLAEILSHISKKEKVSALAALANFKHQAVTAVPQIAHCLSDQDWLVRSFALEALQAIGGDQAQAAIKNAMKTGDAEMLSGSVASSKAYGNSEAVFFGLIESLKRNVLLLGSTALLFTALVLWLRKKGYLSWKL